MTDPTIGVWISENGDVGAPDPRNLYRFVGDNPINEVDPTGLTGKDNHEGPNNANRVMDMLVKNPTPGTRFWVVIFSDAAPKEPENALEAKEGHAWIAVIDTQAETITALGLHPEADADLSASNPSAPGEVRDNSKREFRIARAYPINVERHRDLVNRLGRERRSSPTYNITTNNCASWAIRLAKLQGVSQFHVNIADPDQIIVQGQSINSYTPRNLAAFLQKDQAPGSRRFNVGLDPITRTHRTVKEWTFLEESIRRKSQQQMKAR